jgi:hypothetical protein
LFKCVAFRPGFADAAGNHSSTPAAIRTPAFGRGFLNRSQLASISVVVNKIRTCSPSRPFASSPIASPQRGSSGARLTPESARLAMIALRVYADLLDQPSIDMNEHPWRIEELDSEGRPLEILALAKNAVIARAAYDQAVIQRTGRKLHLRLVESPSAGGPTLRVAAPGLRAVAGSCLVRRRDDPGAMCGRFTQAYTWAYCT